MWISRLVIKKLLNKLGRRPFVNLYIKIAVDCLYSSGSRKIVNSLQKERELDLRGILAISRIDIFWMRRIGHKVESGALPQARLQYVM